MIEISFGNALEKIEIPKELSLEIVQQERKNAIEELQMLRQEFSDPIFQQKFDFFSKDIKKLLLIVNDTDRPTPTAKILDHLLPILKQKRVKIIVATGAHRRTTTAELQKILGDNFSVWKKKTYIHDAKKDTFSFIGNTRFGTEVFFNKLAVDSDGLIIISSIEPHYFAGFTGGRKSLLPGISAYQTIEKNHKLALQKKAAILKLKNNPVHLDMMEAAALLKKKKFAFLALQDENDKIVQLFTDEMNRAFQIGTKTAEKYFQHEVEVKADIIIALVQKPLDKTLYQAQKGLENCKFALKKNGIFILVASCNEGIGNRNFYDLLASFSKKNRKLNWIKNNYRLGYHKTSKLLEFMKDNQLWMITKLPAEKLRKIGIKKFASVQSAIQKATEEKNEKSHLLLIKNAGALVVNTKK